MTRKSLVQIKCDHCHRTVTLSRATHSRDTAMEIQLKEIAGRVGDHSKLLGRADACGADCAEKTARAQVDGMIESITKGGKVGAVFVLTIAAIPFDEPEADS